MHNLAELNLASAMRRGLERECLRVSVDGKIAQTPHPLALGSALTHPYITVDYSEALLEFVTPTFQDPCELLNFLTDLHLFTIKHIGPEIFWNNSMPCLLEDNNIPIASYGQSNIGKMKTIYRRGLLHRYGAAMQAISGVHFNFSLTDRVFEQLRQRDRSKQDLSNYKSRRYMAAIRNLHQLSWVIAYLLGHSPVVCRSFLGDSPESHGLVDFDGKGTLSYLGATSLRLSKMGYTNSGQAHIAVCYDSLDSYIQSLRKTITTRDPRWEKIGVKKNGYYRQLSNNILQLENEYYSAVRPKRQTNSGESPANALRARGIDYVELRSVDINSFSPLGIDLEQILFLDVFLLYCLLTESKELGPQRIEQYRNNQELVARHGRQNALVLWRSDASVKAMDWARELFDGLLAIAQVLDGHYPYSQVVEKFRATLDKPGELYSEKLERELRQKNETFFQYTLKNSTAIANKLRSEPLDQGREQYLKKISAQSLDDQRAIEDSDRLSFDAFLEQYFSKNMAGD